MSHSQREAQRYVEEVEAPSVITLNAVATSHAVNNYLFSALGLRNISGDLEHSSSEVHWLKYREEAPYVTIEVPRQDPYCPECLGRLGAGELLPLPVREA